MKIEEKKRRRGRPRKLTKKCVCEECHHVFIVKKTENDHRFCKKECERKSSQLFDDKEARHDAFLLQVIVAVTTGLFVSGILCYYDICIKSYAALIGIAMGLCMVVALPTLIAMGYKIVYKHFMGE